MKFKLFLLLTLFLMPAIGIAFSEIPKANITVKELNKNQWPAQFSISLAIPENHHVYLNKGDEKNYIPVTIDTDGDLEKAGLKVDKLERPTGVYDKDVKAKVIRDKLDFTLWLSSIEPKKTEKLKQVSLSVIYQLCNDLLQACFRPQTAHIDLPLPLSSPVSSHKSQLSFMDKLLLVFKDNQNNPTVLFALMFVAGLLSIATPCVYPMLPITSMFIINRAKGGSVKEYQHAFVYLAGIVGTYMILGLIAGMTGGAFNVFMQSAWVNLGFALFFTVFALAMLGFFELSFLQNEAYSLEQRSARLIGLGGTLLMGMVAGLVISPCVGPVVFALLLQVADNIADKTLQLTQVNQSLSFWQRLILSAQGSVMMAGFGLGVGLPFFAVGVLKFKKLPKAGFWMNKIKMLLGLVILYFAYTYFHKGMGILAVPAFSTQLLASGLLLLIIAILKCRVLLGNTPAKQKIPLYSSLIAVVFGGWILIYAILGNKPLADVQTNASNSSHACTRDNSINLASAIEEDAGIYWYRNYELAKKVAQQTGKPIFIDFYADWCANCIAFKTEAAKNKALNQVLREKAIVVRLIDKEPEFEKFREDPNHRQLKIGLPYFAILTADGKLSWSGTDYTATDEMIAILNN